MMRRLTLIATTVLLAGATACSYGHPAGQTEKSGAKPSYIVASGPPAAAVSLPAPAAPTTPAPPALAPIHIPPASLQRIGVTLGRVRYGAIADALATAGNVVVDPSHEAAVQVRFSGWIQQEFANRLYQYVHQGQPLFTVYSPQLVTAEQDYLLALRNRAVLAQSPVSGVAAGANALVEASRERLAQWQVPERQIEALRSGRPVRRDITMDAPAGGYITRREVLPNAYVMPGTVIYRLADLSSVWVNAQVFQNNLGLIRVGQAATITVDAWPGRVFHGQVNFIQPNVSESTRTASVRIVLPNPDLALMPGMYVNVTLRIPLGRQLSVPADAVLQTGTRNLVFVAAGGGTLDPREVEVGPRVGDRIVILKGLHAGERIVTSASFLIDSESQLQAALGGFTPPPAGVGANAPAVNAATPAGTRLTLATIPSPPRQGQNELLATLTQAGGGGLDGAQVIARFFLPAMPAMGMAAVSVEATLTGQGGGRYASSVRLPMAGAWRATITAQSGGKTVASRQISLQVIGGGA